MNVIDKNSTSNNEEFIDFFYNLSELNRLLFLKQIFNILDKQQCAYLLGYLLAILDKED